jgi:hypothetical protein
MAEFAIRPLCTTASKNASIAMNGTAPYLGSHLNRQWLYVVASLAWIANIQFALSALTTYATRAVVIKDDSSLSITRLLRPLVDKLSNSGTLLNGEELSGALECQGVAGLIDGSLNFGCLGEYYLDMANDIQVRRHPDGMYLEGSFGLVVIRVRQKFEFQRLLNRFCFPLP